LILDRKKEFVVQKKIQRNADFVNKWKEEEAKHINEALANGLSENEIFDILKKILTEKVKMND
ncbi:MAG: hypothetical protein QXX98_01650, partial [Thermoplasmata archaeon]